MNIQAIASSAVDTRQASGRSADQVQRQRESARDTEREVEKLAESNKKNSVQAEELLQNIKALTEDGVYSVRFETYEDTRDMVINLVEVETGEVIRQIPPDEILGMNKFFSELRGNIIETQS